MQNVHKEGKPQWASDAFREREREREREGERERQLRRKCDTPYIA